MNIPNEWIHAIEGGALIGLSASLLLVFNGRVAGISGIAGGLLTPSAGDIRWRVLFLAGLLLAGVMMRVALPEAFPPSTASLGSVLLAGLLVGFGTRVSNGCTSGHGICGMARLSPRSMVATVTFITSGALAVLVASGGAR